VRFERLHVVEGHPRLPGVRERVVVALLVLPTDS
jgi:hypothetical protein